MLRIIPFVLLLLPTALRAQPDSVAFDHLPFAMYDTDTGFGAGYKGVLRNALGSRESFDVTVFLSTKGERWVRLGWSLPDAELRQGTAYPFAMDVVADYDKIITNNFFGVGSGSRFDDREIYTTEPLELTAAFSRGFTPEFIGLLQLRFKRMWSYNFDKLGVLRSHSANSSTADLWSMMLQFRHDTRNSVLHPSSGSVVQTEIEHAFPVTEAAKTWTREAVWIQYYSEWSTVICAVRVGIQSMQGDDIPLQHMLPIGGNSTVRGIPKDRYLDRNSAILNAELRFPLYRRLGAVVGIDAGAVSAEFDELSSSRWMTTPVLGLRLIFDTFVTRADLGYSADAIGFYLNFGQIF